jgi:hypothetical protein
LSRPNFATACAQCERAVAGEDFVSITLQSTVGGFSAAFMKRLPQLEAAMVAHGLDPSAFILSKDNAASANARPLGPFFYDYTVFVDGKHFTVTEPNDARFMEYLMARCVAVDDPLTPRHQAHGLLQKFLNWMDRPI